MNQLPGGWAGWGGKKKARNEMASILQHTPVPCYACRLWVSKGHSFPPVVELFCDLGAAVTISMHYMLSQHGSSSIIPRIRVQVFALRASRPG